MVKLFFWTYLVNFTLLLCHEIDSAYWKEWQLAGIHHKNAIQGFVLIHIPVIFLFLLGLIWIHQMTVGGLVLSSLLAVAGIFAFFFHFYHIRKGNPGFSNMTSKLLLFSTIFVSLFQGILSLVYLIN